MQRFFMNKILFSSAFSLGLLLSFAPSKGMDYDFSDLRAAKSENRLDELLTFNYVNNDSDASNAGVSEKNPVNPSTDNTPVVTPNTQEIVANTTSAPVQTTPPTIITPPVQQAPVQKVSTDTTSTLVQTTPSTTNIPSVKVEDITNQPAPVDVVKDPIHVVKSELIEKANPENAKVKNVKPSMFANMKAWLGSKKTNTINYLKDFRARGWSKWTAKEKVAIVAITAAVTALVTYGAYKAYKALTKEEDKKNKKAMPARRVARA